MKLSLPAVTVLLVTSASAQSTPPFRFEPLNQIRQYLQLTDSQLRTILTNNEEYNRWSAERQNRIRQVQTEIGEETAKSPLDPAALGIRYAEIETICREMKDRANESRTRNLDVLNPDQKTRLGAIEEALKLAPVISEAQYGNLTGTLTTPPYAFTSISMAVGGGAIGSSIIGPVNGCYNPLLQTTVRWFNTAAASSR
jgi:hypothetical protein